MELDKELLAKAKEAKNPEELITLAKENGTELTAESAKMYFDLLHPKTGELSDDELDNVAGGGCHAKDGRLVVTIGHICDNFCCQFCGGGRVKPPAQRCARCDALASCSSCTHCTYERGLWLCNYPASRK